MLAALGVIAGLVLASGLPWSLASSSGAPEVANEVPVTATHQLRQPANNSPMVVADPNDDDLLVLANRLDAPDFGCSLHLSGDGGRHWVPTDPVPELPTGADKCYAPEVAFDSTGTLYLLFVGLQGDGNEPMGAFLATSTNQGRSFTEPRPVLGPLNFAVRMAIDQTMGERGRLHLVWLQSRSDPPLGGFPTGPNPILAAHSDDGGLTFSEPVQVSDAERARVVAPALALGADHAVHVGYYDLQEDARDYQGLAGPVWEGNWSIVVATSLDGGRRFGPGAVVDQEIVPPERPMLIFTMAPPALAAGENRVCTAWTDARHGDPDILSRCASRQGHQWEALRRVNDDVVGNGIRQYLPRLSMAPDGRLDAIYLDRRHHAENSRNDVSYTHSDNGGRSFGSSRRLTSESSSPGIGQRYIHPAAEGQIEIGGRLATLSQRSGLIAAWPDTRYPALGVPYQTGQNIFAVEVRLPSPAPSGWVRGLGFVLVAFGITCAGVLARRRFVGRKGPQSVERRSNGGATSRSPWRSTGVLRRGWSAIATIGLVVALGGTVVLAEQLHSPAPAPDLMPQQVDVTMTEYRFEYAPPSQPGRTVFQVRNVGAEDHVFGLYLLPDDLPPIDEQLKGDERRGVDSPLELPVAEPGEVQTVGVDLVEGQRYAILCFLGSTAENQTHAVLGMNSEFRVAP